MEGRLEVVQSYPSDGLWRFETSRLAPGKYTVEIHTMEHIATRSILIESNGDHVEIEIDLETEAEERSLERFGGRVFLDGEPLLSQMVTFSARTPIADPHISGSRGHRSTFVTGTDGSFVVKSNAIIPGQTTLAFFSEGTDTFTVDWEHESPSSIVVELNSVTLTRAYLKDAEGCPVAGLRFQQGKAKWALSGPDGELGFFALPDEFLVEVHSIPTPSPEAPFVDPLWATARANPDSAAVYDLGQTLSLSIRAPESAAYFGYASVSREGGSPGLFSFNLFNGAASLIGGRLGEFEELRVFASLIDFVEDRKVMYVDSLPAGAPCNLVSLEEEDRLELVEQHPFCTLTGEPSALLTTRA